MLIPAIQTCRAARTGLASNPNHLADNQPRIVPKAACAKVTLIGNPLENSSPRNPTPKAETTGLSMNPNPRNTP
jgi:hypothetical protein